MTILKIMFDIKLSFFHPVFVLNKLVMLFSLFFSLYIYNGIHRHNKLEKYTVTKHFLQQVPGNKYFLPTYFWFTAHSSINRGLLGKISR